MWVQRDVVPPSMTPPPNPLPPHNKKREGVENTPPLSTIMGGGVGARQRSGGGYEREAATIRAATLTIRLDRAISGS